MSNDKDFPAIVGCLDTINFMLSKHANQEALAILAAVIVSKIHSLAPQERPKAVQQFHEALMTNFKRWEQMERTEH